MRKFKSVISGVVLLGAAAMFASPAMAGFKVGSTGTKGWGIDFNPATGKTVYVFPGKKQIIADPVANTKTVTRRVTGRVVERQYPEGSHRGGPSMGLARFFYKTYNVVH